MAIRPVFEPKLPDEYLARSITFEWVAGMSATQKRKSLMNLHEAARKIGLNKILEISTKSIDPVGVAASAFNLQLIWRGRRISVEQAYQSSKVFTNGGPYLDIIDLSPVNAKRDERLRQSGELSYFIDECNERWPLKPTSAFYEWIYISALQQNPKVADHFMQFDGFTDIEFNPVKSVSCQAAAAAKYVALRQSGLLNDHMLSRDSFLKLAKLPSAAQSAFDF